VVGSVTGAQRSPRSIRLVEAAAYAGPIVSTTAIDVPKRRALLVAVAHHMME